MFLSAWASAHIHFMHGRSGFRGLKGLADDNRDAEIRHLKRELARVTEERDILKKATAYFARDAK
jgi:transposase